MWQLLGPGVGLFEVQALLKGTEMVVKELRGIWRGIQGKGGGDLGRLPDSVESGEKGSFLEGGVAETDLVYGGGSR